MKYLLLICLLAFATVANAQSGSNPKLCRDKSEPIRILLKPSFKIKAANSVNSATARVADYVEFTTMEPIYSDEDYPVMLFDKGTSIYAVVTRREHRHFPMVRGRLEIALEPLMSWDNRRIEMAITRHGELTRNETGRVSQEELQKRNKGINKPCKVDPYNCVAARGNAEVSLLVTAVAGASGAAVSSVAKDDDTKFIAATSFFSIAKDLGNLLNGTDVGIVKDEVFNLQLKAGSDFCAIPKQKPTKEEPPPTKIIIVRPSQ
jgi:hypothetical protein